MNVLQIGSDRSRRGILVPGSPASRRQEAYAAALGEMTIIGFSRAADGFAAFEAPHLRVIPTASRSPLFYGLDALRIAQTLPRPDVVSVQDPFETGFLGLFIAWHVGAPLYVQVHTDFLAPAFARQSFINRIRVLLAGYVLHRAARIRVVSPRIERSLAHRYGDALAPVSVLPIYAETNAMPDAGPNLPERFGAFSHRIVFVGRLEPEKGARRALESFAAAAPATAALIVVGTGSQRDTLVARAHALGVASRVFFEGEHPAGPYLALADLVLVPSAYEGYGLIIVEALAAGKPVLATDVGIAREAGAIVVADGADYAHALAQWFSAGVRTGTLCYRPYASVETYVAAFAADVAAAANG
jgi:glycosyltransferase involved in cell wall biosynthesis